MRRFGRNKSTLSLFLILLFVSTMIVSSEAVDTATPQKRTWARTYGGFDLDFFRSVRQTSDGGFVLAGETGSFSADTTWVVKLDLLGNLMWQDTLGGGGCEGSYSVLQASDGEFVVSGESSLFPAVNTCITKLDAMGNPLWQKAYSGAGVDEAFSLEPTSDGGFIVGGRTNYYIVDRPSDAFALRLDADGNVVWQKTYGGASVDVFDSVQETTDGGFIAIGTTYSFGAGDKDAWVLRLDVAGNVLWQKTYGGPSTDQILTLAQISDGSFVVAGGTNSFGAGGFDAWVLHLDSNGSILWEKTFGSTFNDQVQSTTLTRDGALALAGAIGCQGTGCFDAWFVKVNLRGEVLWQTTYEGQLFDAIFSLEETTDRGFIAAGEDTRTVESFGDGLVLKLDQKGGIPGECHQKGPLKTSVIDTNSTVTLTQAVVGDVSTVVTETTGLLTATLATVMVQCLTNGRHAWAASGLASSSSV